MTLTPKQKRTLSTAVSEALAFRTMVALDANEHGRPTMLQLEAKLAVIRELAATLRETDALHRAIVDRCVDAIEEGLLS